eukprot:Skav224245  [mRNA]  locus=scaffold939:1465982:1467977:- [translate_table: standard]
MALRVIGKILVVQRRSKVWHTAALAGSFVNAWQCQQRFKSHDGFMAASRTKLLIDADSHSIEQMKQAVSLLKNEGQEVETTIFAPPRMVENRKWCQLMKAPDVTFQPVFRSHDSLLEPNDEAIRKEIAAIPSQPNGVGCVALMTQDTDFIDAMVSLQSSGLRTVLLTSEVKHPVIRKYKAANIKVFKLQQECRGIPVRAVLDRNGDGSVHLAEPYASFENEAKGKHVMAFLQKLNFMGERGFSIQGMAKFWFSNGLGPLTVFPQQLATLSVHEVIKAQCEAAYECYNGDLAFFLPISSSSTITKTGIQKYGSLKARMVFRGGGPFILQDSPDLTAQALRRLGYLDDDLNNDLTEALFCFLNTAENKTPLRKMGALPLSGDTSSAVCEKLRAAFLSHESRGSWQYVRKDESSMLPILLLLRDARVISQTDYLPSEVFEAMKMYADKHGLPAMRTFNGFAARILQSIDKSPTTRALIEVNPR